MIRKGRLTVSNFGSVRNCKWVAQFRVKWVLDEYDLSRLQAINWGIIKFTSRRIWALASSVRNARCIPWWFGRQECTARGKVSIHPKRLHQRRSSVIRWHPKKCWRALWAKKEQVYWHQVQGDLFFYCMDNKRNPYPQNRERFCMGWQFSLFTGLLHTSCNPRIH